MWSGGVRDIFMAICVMISPLTAWVVPHYSLPCGAHYGGASAVLSIYCHHDKCEESESFMHLWVCGTTDVGRVTQCWVIAWLKAGPV